MKTKKYRIFCIFTAFYFLLFSTSCSNGKGSSEDVDAKELEIEQLDIFEMEVVSDELPESPLCCDSDALEVDMEEMEDASDGIEAPPNPEVTVMEGVLPRRIGGITAFTDGVYAYVPGGAIGSPPSNLTDEIYRYDPSLDRAETLSIHLPSPLFISASAWDGSNAYLFGGFSSSGGGGLTQQIIRYNPSEGIVEIMPTTLSEPLGRVAAVYDGNFFYIMGGNTGGFTPAGFVDSIYRYDSSNATITLANARLPQPIASRIGGIYCNQRILFLGGWGAGGKSNQVCEYIPEADTLRVLGATLPVPQDGGALVCAGKDVYLFGGESTETLDTIIKFDTETDAISVLSVTLPQPLRGHAAVFINGSAYILGGTTPSGLSNQIIRFTP